MPRIRCNVDCPNKQGHYCRASEIIVSEGALSLVVSCLRNAVFERRCGTCTKRGKHEAGCDVLNERIGENEPCWAWSNDPDWEKKIRLARG